MLGAFYPLPPPVRGFQCIPLDNDSFRRPQRKTNQRRKHLALGECGERSYVVLIRRIDILR